MYAVDRVNFEPIKIVVMYVLIKARSESRSQATRMRCFKFCNGPLYVKFTLGGRCDWLPRLNSLYRQSPLVLAHARQLRGKIGSFIVQIMRTSFPTFTCHTPSKPFSSAPWIKFTSNAFC